MAYYLTTYCDGSEGPIVDSSDAIFNLGVYFIVFTGGTESGCYTLVNVTDTPPNEGISTATPFNDCLECLQQNDFSFLVSACTIPNLFGPVSSIEFSQFPLGQYYTLCANDPFIFVGCFCFTVYGIVPNFFPYTFNPQGPYFDCNCSGRESGTEYFECVICCDCGATGGTVTQIVPPHPVWTDGYGTPVTQMGSVSLGGMFGLNN